MVLIGPRGLPERSPIARSCASMKARAGSSPSRPPTRAGHLAVRGARAVLVEHVEQDEAAGGGLLLLAGHDPPLLALEGTSSTGCASRAARFATSSSRLQLFLLLRFLDAVPLAALLVVVRRTPSFDLLRRSAHHTARSRRWAAPGEVGMQGMTTSARGCASPPIIIAGPRALPRRGRGVQLRTKGSPLHDLDHAGGRAVARICEQHGQMLVIARAQRRSHSRGRWSGDRRIEVDANWGDARDHVGPNFAVGMVVPHHHDHRCARWPRPTRAV